MGCDGRKAQILAFIAEVYAGDRTYIDPSYMPRLCPLPDDSRGSFDIYRKAATRLSPANCEALPARPCGTSWVLRSALPR